MRKKVEVEKKELRRNCGELREWEKPNGVVEGWWGMWAFERMEEWRLWGLINETAGVGIER